MIQDNNIVNKIKISEEDGLPKSISDIVNLTNQNADKLVDFSVLNDEVTLFGVFRQFIKAVGNTVASTLGMEGKLSPEQFSILVDTRKRYANFIENGSSDNYNKKAVNE